MDLPPAPIAEELIRRVDGSPYRERIRRFAVSRDGNIIVFEGSATGLGLPEDRSRLFVVDRRIGVPRAACRIRDEELLRWHTPSWDLSEDGRFVTVSHRRFDLETCEVDEVDPLPMSARYGSVAYFEDGSGVVYRDDSVPGAYAQTFDRSSGGRAEARFPWHDLTGVAESIYVAADRTGSAILVSGYHWPVEGDRPEYWVRYGRRGEMRQIELPRLTVNFVHGAGRTGVFSDDGRSLYLHSPDDGPLRLDLETWELTPQPTMPSFMFTDPLDDGRVLGYFPPSDTTTVHAVRFFSAVVAVYDPEGPPQLVTADLSAYPEMTPETPREATMVVASPASHEMFFEVPVDDEGGYGLFVVPIPPRAP